MGASLGQQVLLLHPPPVPAGGTRGGGPYWKMGVLESEPACSDSTVTTSPLALKPWRNGRTWPHPSN